MNSTAKCRPQKAFHAFSIGIMKSGTTSISSIFETSYRAEHEPDKLPVLSLIKSYNEGRASKEQVLDFLAERDSTLNLELESSGFLAPLTGELAEIFPKSRYILTYRNCRSWLDSCFNHLLGNPMRPEVRSYLQWWLRPEDCQVHAQDQILLQHDLFPLESFLRTWARHYSNVIEHAPMDRLLVIKTEQISQSLPQLARFLDLNPETLTTDASHQRKNSNRFDLLSTLEATYVEDSIERICSPVVEKLQALTARR